MKIRTVEKYIRYTDLPYTELLERAKKGGLKVEINKSNIKIKDELNYTVTLYPHTMSRIDEGMALVQYNFDK